MVTAFGDINVVIWLCPKPMWLVWHLQKRREENEGTNTGGGQTKERPSEKLTLLALSSCAVSFENCEEIIVF